MKSKTSTSIGALHPILFFVGVYIVALFFSIFICSSIFYSLNPKTSEATGKTEQAQKPTPSTLTASVAALR